MSNRRSVNNRATLPRRRNFKPSTNWFRLCTTIALVSAGFSAWADDPQANKQIARQFYQDLWFSNRTERYRDYVADSYIVHDTGDRKSVIEPATEQRAIADFFWQHGEIFGAIDYQIAEDDLVATRWHMRYSPSSWIGRLFIGEGEIPIINVFRFDNGKIVEIWNHRHDIDTPQTRRFSAQGFAVGLLCGLLLAWMWRCWCARNTKQKVGGAGKP